MRMIKSFKQSTESKKHAFSKIFGMIGLCIGAIPGFVIIIACTNGDDIGGIFLPILSFGAIILILISACISVTLYDLCYVSASKFYTRIINNSSNISNDTK